MGAKRKIIIAFVPVLHAGYLELFNRHRDARELYIPGKEILEKYRSISKDIRALDPESMRNAIKGLLMFERVEILDESTLESIKSSDSEIVMPNEDISRDIADLHFESMAVTFDDIFLRWDEDRTLAHKEPLPDEAVSVGDFDREVMRGAEIESRRSPDWWRHVGAILVRGTEVVLKTHNSHMPSAHSPYAHGDPRNNFKKGVLVEYATSIHAERRLIATCAKQGIATEGMSLYVTTFPCHGCARLIALAGISSCYYASGYSTLDGAELLRSYNVRLIRVG